MQCPLGAKSLCIPSQWSRDYVSDCEQPYLLIINEIEVGVIVRREEVDEDVKEEEEVDWRVYDAQSEIVI